MSLIYMVNHLIEQYVRVCASYGSMVPQLYKIHLYITKCGTNDFHKTYYDSS